MRKVWVTDWENDMDNDVFIYLFNLLARDKSRPGHPSNAVL